MTIPFELMVEEQDTWCYRVRWCDGESDSVMLANIPDTWVCRDHCHV
jgi:hypothetical protein